MTRAYVTYFVSWFKFLKFSLKTKRSHYLLFSKCCHASAANLNERHFKLKKHYNGAPRIMKLKGLNKKKEQQLF